MNTTITPKRKKVTTRDEFVTISRKEYELLLSMKNIREFTPTVAEKRALARARKNRAAGKFLTLDELKHKLGFTS